MNSENDLILGIEELRSISQPVGYNLVSGIYFLFQDDEIVYVGQAACMDVRILQHITEKIKKFNRWSWIPCQPERLDETEASYILKFLPKYNKYLPSLFGYLVPKSLKKRLGVNLRAIKKTIAKHQPHDINGRYQVDEIKKLLEQEGYL